MPMGSSCGFAPGEACGREKETGMDTEREYRQRAEDCLRLANEAGDAFVKAALAELASEFHSMADTAEACGINLHRPKAW